MFDAKDDGKFNSANPYDLFFSLWTTPNNQPPKFDGNWTSRFAERIPLGGSAFVSWNYGISVISNSRHLECYVEFPLMPLQKYGLTSSNPRIGITAYAWQYDVYYEGRAMLQPEGGLHEETWLGVRNIVENGSERWPQLFLTNASAQISTTTSTQASTFVRTPLIQNTSTLTQPVVITTMSRITAENGYWGYAFAGLVVVAIIGITLCAVRRRILLA